MGGSESVQVRALFWVLIVIMNLACGPSSSVHEDIGLDHAE